LRLAAQFPALGGGDAAVIAVVAGEADRVRPLIDLVFQLDRRARGLVLAVAGGKRRADVALARPVGEGRNRGAQQSGTGKQAGRQA